MRGTGPIPNEAKKIAAITIQNYLLNKMVTVDTVAYKIIKHVNTDWDHDLK